MLELHVEQLDMKLEHDWHKLLALIAKLFDRQVRHTVFELQVLQLERTAEQATQTELLRANELVVH